MARRSWPRNASESLPTAITARMAYSSVLLLLLLVNTSTALFFQRPRQMTSCVSGMPEARLTRLTTGMDTSNVFDNLLPRILIPRVSGTPGNVAVKQFISREMQSLGWTVEEDAFASYTPYGYKNFTNVIATFNPYATKRIVVACHFDSKYFPAYRGHSFLGATDSAVPCSVMMDTARKLTDFLTSANSNVATLQFLFLDGEEAFHQWTSTDSLYGSRHLASKWQGERDSNDPTAINNLENIVYFILLDLIGTSDTHIVNHFHNTSHLFQRLHNIETCLKSRGLLNRLSGRPLFDSSGSSYPVEDDHVPFMQRGVSILHLISTPFPRVWHTMSDNLSRLNVAVIDDFSRIFRLFVTSVLQESSTAV